MADGKKQFWESPEEIQKIMKRREIRQRLQQEFNRVFFNPYRLSHHIEMVNFFRFFQFHLHQFIIDIFSLEQMDPAVSRYSAMRASIYEHWKPNWRGFWKWSFLSYIPITLMAYRLAIYMVSVNQFNRIILDFNFSPLIQREVDADCRTGVIPYEKRDFRRI